MDKLKDKNYKNNNYLSRYSPFPYYYNTEDNKYVYGTTAQLNQDNTYLIHKCKSGDNFDSLAQKYYNNASLYWIICDFNQIQDPFIELEKGTELKIPTLTTISYK